MAVRYVRIVELGRERHDAHQHLLLDMAATAL